MKIWLKISLICIAVLLFTVSICSTLLLFNSKEKILSIAAESALKEQENLQDSFVQMLEYYIQDDREPVVRQSLAQYYFKNFAKKTSVLMSNNETIFSNIAFDPSVFLPLTGEEVQSQYSGIINGRNILITGGKVKLFSEQYAVYTVNDITDLYGSISQMIWQFIFISAFCISLGITMIIILVRLTTKQLKNLGSSARRIANGEYAERVKLSAKDEIGDLAQDFNVMAEAVQNHIEELKKIMQRQQLFMGGLTHEFKTPLTSIIGHAETLLYTSMSEEVVTNSLLHIYEQCMWLERLRQKLLKLITLQEDLELREESVEALLEAVRGSVSEMLQNQGIKLEVSCGIPTLPMDFDLMMSLLVNLVDNAVKASSNEGTIGLFAYDKTIEVEDHGIGISSAEISRITEPFYMVDKARSKIKGGAGIGLALVKKIAEVHGAQVTIESELGYGTKVKVIFPDNK